MTDIEMLQRAAKAAGVEYDFAADDGLWIKQPRGLISIINWHCWNPLEDDVAALWLAVKLKLNILQGDFSCGVNDEREIDEVELHGADGPYAATRRAVVRAAAAAMVPA
jgi:hypothetical protein